MGSAFSSPRIGTGSNSPSHPLDLLCIGELLIDSISRDQVDSLGAARQFGVFVGGQAANVAQNVSLLGGRSAVVARVGADGFGVVCRQHLESSGVDTAFLITDAEAPTTFCVVARSVGTPDFIIYRGADSRLQAGDLPAEALQKARAVHASAFALSREPARSAVIAALSAAKAAGALVSLDPTYHPKVWGVGEDPLPVLAEAYRYVDVTKPSLDDCHRLFGPGETPEAYARRFLDLGPRLVVLTLGAGGALMATADGVLQRFPGREIQVADVTGAGDAFWAGLLMGLLDGLSDAAAVSAGMEVAQIKIRQVGPLTTALDRRALYRQVGLCQV